MKQKVVFFGNEKLATGIPEPRPLIREAVKQAGFEIEAVVTGLEVPDHEAELAVLSAHGQILRQDVLQQFPLGIVNIHPSLLPVYRGPTPIEQAILDGSVKTGVSIMKITHEMDAGPIYKQKTVHLTGNESKAKLAETLQKLGAEMLAEALPAIANGSLKPRQQSHVDRDASYTKLIKKSDGIIDWHKPADVIEREIRAYLGWPGSRTTLFNKDVIITAAHVVPANFGEEPGYVEPVENTILMIETANGRICIDRLKPAGKKEMTAAEFLRGLKN
ncbi:MAG TPA: methionyl-tRNA formyltransferase [Candidatus Saccharimonadales bacterium]|nr:methionyl-tRNA formyltransferase [Candidatus Saccharimonadales bacterium]